MERIFVQIASYRDPELQSTLEDLFAKAHHPDRISVGICLQLFPELDHHCEYHSERESQIRCIRVRADESRGVCWARSLIQGLHHGEEYTLQIDSHMRFEPGWDDAMTCTLHQCPSVKPILTTYPPGYTPPGNLEEPCVTVMQPASFDEYGVLLLESVSIPMVKAPSEPIQSALCSACFLFGPASVISEVPYDPHLYFFGEEISLAVRLWTHGWDFYHPHIPLLHHLWDRSYRVAHWEEVPSAKSLDAISRGRVNQLLGQAGERGEVVAGVEKYGLGSQRTLAEYESFSGISFQLQTFEGYRFFPNVGSDDDQPLEPFSW